jgi:hypothetical protein
MKKTKKSTKKVQRVNVTVLVTTNTEATGFDVIIKPEFKMINLEQLKAQLQAALEAKYLSKKVKKVKVKSAKITIESDVPFYMSANLHGTAKGDSITIKEKRVFYSTQMGDYNAQMDIIDLCTLARKLEKLNYSLTIGNMFELNNQWFKEYTDIAEFVDPIIKPGATFNVTKFHTPEDVGTAISYMRKRVKEMMEFEEIYSDYFGSEKCYKAYFGEPITLRIGCLAQFNLKDYQLIPKTMRLPDGSHHENIFIHVVDNGCNTYAAKTITTGCGEHSNQEFSIYCKTTTNDAGVVGNVTNIVYNGSTYKVDTKYARHIYDVSDNKFDLLDNNPEVQTTYTWSKSFKDNQGKLVCYNDKFVYGAEFIKALNVLLHNEYKFNRTEDIQELANMCGDESAFKTYIEYSIMFNSDEHYYNCNDMAKVLRAIKLMTYFNLIDLDRITFYRGIKEERFYTDSDRTSTYEAGSHGIFKSAPTLSKEQLRTIKVAILKNIKNTIFKNIKDIYFRNVRDAYHRNTLVECTLKAQDALQVEYLDDMEYIIHVILEK